MKNIFELSCMLGAMPETGYKEVKPFTTQFAGLLDYWWENVPKLKKKRPFSWCQTASFHIGLCFQSILFLKPNILNIVIK